MAGRVVIEVVCALLSVTLVSAVHQGTECDPTDNRVRFEVLPGRGWDNLRNIEMGQVFAANYSACSVSDDGQFVVPSSVKLLPRKSSQVQRFSDIYTNYRDYRSLTAVSINMAGHGDFDGKVEVSGSFSTEHQKVKVTQINTRSVTTRVQLRHTLYTAIQEPETPLNAAFRDRLLDMAYQIEANNSMMVDYLADMLIADYGTHYTTSVDAGGVLAILDFFRSDQNTLTDSQMNMMKTGAAVNFEKVAGFNRSLGITWGTNDTKEYNKNVTDGTIISAGGPALGPGSSADMWVDGIMKNLVAVDRSGDPLFYAVTMQSLGSLATPVVAELRLRVKRGVERYYHANTIIGCMERSSDSFNALANVAGDDCKPPTHNHTFGGVYQTCYGDAALCKEVVVNNPMTGGPTCAVGFRAIHLWSRVYKCRSSCHGWWIFKRCDTLCATYDLFWCAAASSESANSKLAYLFGGVYNNMASNPMTGAQSCPSSFFALPMGGSGLRVCLSRDFELGQEHSFDFGGFFSCHAGNPYTLTASADGKGVADYLIHQDPSKWPKRCPSGFAQHMADIDGACEIMYCIRDHTLSRVQRVQVQRPPFTRIPDGSIPNPPLRSNAISYSTDGSRTWVRDAATNSWSFKAESASWGKDEGDGKTVTVVASVLGSLVGTMCIGLAIAFVFVIRQRRQAAGILGGVDNPNYCATESIQEERPDGQTADTEATGV